MTATTDNYSFRTDRLRCEPLASSQTTRSDETARTIAAIFNASDTDWLPPDWHGEFTPQRAQAWIVERESDSTTLLVTETDSDEPVGVVVLATDPDQPAPGSELRIGYVLRRDRSGRGLGTELVTGLVAWARTQPAVMTLRAGVDPSNIASIRVLERAGFVVTESQQATQYQITVGDVWAEPASSWDEDPYTRAYAAAAFDSLTKLIAEAGRTLHDARVLDFGCGTGLLTEKLVATGANVVAIDTSEAMLAVLEEKATLMETGQVQLATSLSQPGEPFDLVVCSSVLAFVPDYRAAVAELVERLVPHGVFVQWDWDRVPGEEGGLSAAEIESALSDAGLVDVDVSVGFSIEVDGATMAPLMGHGHKPTL